MGRLQDQVAIVTGGGSGLGAAVVQRFVTEGARVVLFDRDEAAAHAVAKSFADKVTVVTGDARSFTDNCRAVDAAVAGYGGLDIAVGNAGIWDYSVPLVDLAGEELSASFDELFQINVLGYTLLAKAAMKALAKSRGSIVYTVSNAGFLAGGGGVLYTATKHAVVGLIRQLAFELAPHVRVNGIAPGPISTHLRGPASLDMQDRQFPGERLQETAADYVPLGQMPTPQEYAGGFVFLACREDNVPTTGTIIQHDGGFGIRGIGQKPRGGDKLLHKLGLQDD